jgi:hypothetical protein
MVTFVHVPQVQISLETGGPGDATGVETLSLRIRLAQHRL